MTTYINYFTYDGSEYDLWSVHTKKTDSVQTLRTTHLPSLIEGCQPDISVLSLVKCKVSKTEYTTLTTSKHDSPEVQRILERIENDPTTEVIFFIDGEEIQLGFCHWYNSKLDTDEVLEDLRNTEQTNPTYYNSLVTRYCNYLI